MQSARSSHNWLNESKFKFFPTFREYIQYQLTILLTGKSWERTEMKSVDWKCSFVALEKRFQFTTRVLRRQLLEYIQYQLTVLLTGKSWERTEMKSVDWKCSFVALEKRFQFTTRVLRRQLHGLPLQRRLLCLRCFGSWYLVVLRSLLEVFFASWILRLTFQFTSSFIDRAI